MKRPFKVVGRDGKGDQYTLTLMPRKYFPDLSRHECGVRMQGPLLAMTIGLTDEQRLELIEALVAMGTTS